MLPATAGVLLKREPLSNTRFAQTTLNEARRHARTLLRDAQREASLCYERAARAGYEAGFREALRPALEFLRECKRVQLNLRKRMEADAQEALSSVLSDARLVMRLAQQLGKRRTELEMTAPRVTLPQAAGRIAASVRSRVEEIWPDAEVMYADTESFIVEWADQVLEFAPQRTASRLTGVVMRAVDETIAALDDRSLIHSILEHALVQVQGEQAVSPFDAAANLTQKDQDE
ncbi:hypothetical protein WJ69_34175 [Burkholderia ubonensis]|nr:hypothetical protein WJ69_34175 [Burkholderia ubonensis]